MKKELKLWQLMGFSVLLTLFFLFVFAMTHGLYPFGNNSFVLWDAFNQYIDLFAWYKDVLVGKSSLNYTLSAGLGQTGIALFAYYLASPFNVLVYFFEKNNLAAFFNLIVALKVITINITSVYYFKKRFTKLSSMFVLLFACIFTFSEYTLIQASNVMWLDGVYLLPLILLGVYDVVHTNRSSLFSIALGASLIFSWYTGFINLLFSGIWFLLEYALYHERKRPTLKPIVSYICGVGLALLLSAILMLPNVLALRSGVGESEWHLFQSVFRDTPLHTFGHYFIGALSQSKILALYAGSMVLISIILLFISAKVSLYQRMILFSALILTVVGYYYQPIWFIFSLSKAPNGFEPRFSYGVFLMVIYVATFYQNSVSDFKDRLPISKIFLGVGVMLFGYQLINNTSLVRVFVTLCLLGISSVLYVFCQRNTRSRQWLIMGLFVVTCCEMGLNGLHIMKHYSVIGRAYKTNVLHLNQYNLKAASILQNINDPNEWYRITSLVNRDLRNHLGQGIRVNFNESLAFGYKGVSTYTSTAEANYIRFLDQLGYRNVMNKLTIVPTSIVPVDSLLGVKYIVSQQPVAYADKKVTDGDRSVYENKMALPVAFTYRHHDVQLMSQNPFIYTNNIYAYLTGVYSEIYTPVAKMDDTQNGEERTLTIRHQLGVDSELFGYFTGESVPKMDFKINENLTQHYFSWLSPKVIYLPKQDGKTSVVLKHSDAYKIKPVLYFYQPSAMKKAYDSLKQKEAKIEKFDDGHVRLKAIATQDNEHVLVTIPYHNSWRVFRNGAEIQAQAFEDALMSIPLLHGENDIELVYVYAGKWEGVLLTIVGVVILLGIIGYEKYRKV